MIATYRLQLRPEFDFDDAAALVPYFAKLGVSHLYLSPITEARPGSTHGYDVIDHNALSGELGGREGFDRLRQKARAAGLGLLLDFVPNHAGVGSHNASWQDVLAHGPYAAYADYFDIDWTPLKPELQGKILLPFLGRPYGEVLDDGEIGLLYDDGRFYAAYFDNRFAIAPRTYAEVLGALLPRYERTEPYFDLKDLAEAYGRLEPAEREKAEALRPRLKTLAERIDLSDLDGLLEKEATHDLLERQHWRLAFWKTAGAEINYRRFFDINGLVALRMEDEDVFWDAHRLLGELLAQDGVDGVRIDHIDGLFDPHHYLNLLKDAGAQHIWVEKITAPGETPPEAWPVEGTTGYAFMNDAMGVLVQKEGELPLNRIYRRAVPAAQPFEEDVYESKIEVMDTSLTSELARLAYGLDRLSEADYHTRDFTLEAIREALTAITAAFERYRTYLPYDQDEAEEIVREVVHRARQRNATAEPTVYDFIAAVILGNVRPGLEEAQRAWVGRFQQYTAPVAAKGVEDTAFYRYLRLVALNEVGGEPEPFGTTRHAFHARCRFRARQYPRALLATATHDHKRGEDTRMRLIALAEMPEKWDEAVHALQTIGRRHDGEHGPSPADAYLFYQLVAALWQPATDEEADAHHEALPERLWTYMQKAARERKRRTSWLHPNEAYENDLERFVRAVLADEELPEAIGSLAERLAERGFFNMVSQLVLKATTPGIPDFYQGTELLDLSLVDPDNRRAVDYEKRQALLDEFANLLEQPDAEALRPLLDARDPEAKFYLTARLLKLRGTHEALFSEGDYEALDVEGEGADHWLAFARTHGEDALLVIVPRSPASFDAARSAAITLPEALAGRRWTDALTGTALEPGAALDAATLPLPWAVLVSAEA